MLDHILALLEQLKQEHKRHDDELMQIRAETIGQVQQIIKLERAHYEAGRMENSEGRAMEARGHIGVGVPSSSTQKGRNE